MARPLRPRTYLRGRRPRYSSTGNHEHNHRPSAAFRSPHRPDFHCTVTYVAGAYRPNSPRLSRLYPAPSRVDQIAHKADTDFHTPTWLPIGRRKHPRVVIVPTARQTASLRPQTCLRRRPIARVSGPMSTVPAAGGPSVSTDVIARVDGAAVDVTVSPTSAATAAAGPPVGGMGLVMPGYTAAEWSAAWPRDEATAQVCRMAGWGERCGVVSRQPRPPRFACLHTWPQVGGSYPARQALLVAVQLRRLSPDPPVGISLHGAHLWTLRAQALCAHPASPSLLVVRVRSVDVRALQAAHHAPERVDRCGVCPP
jgi:hypothetical protein